MTPPNRLSRYVVDASVAVKWHLRDEADLEHADALLTDFREGRIQLIAPEQIRYEVPSAIRNSLRTGRLTPSEARTAIADFLAWRFPTVRTDVLVLAGYDWALRIGCSLYDGLYVGLAQMAGCPLARAAPG